MKDALFTRQNTFANNKMLDFQHMMHIVTQQYCICFSYSQTSMNFGIIKLISEISFLVMHLYAGVI